MISSVFWENPAVVGLILAIPGAILGYLGYRRSLEVDDATEQAGLVSGQTTTIALAVDSLNKVIAVLQEDNKILRGDIIALRELKKTIVEIEKSNGP